jgi:hypothetical protein
VLCRQPEAGGGYKLIDTVLTVEEKILDGILFKIFQSENIIKLGMGPTNDLKRLAWSYPWLPSLDKFSSVLDIHLLAKKGYPSVSGKDLEGLNKLSIMQLGQFCSVILFATSHLFICHFDFILNLCRFG